MSRPEFLADIVKYCLIGDSTSNEGVLDSMVPGLAAGLAGTVYDWNFTSIPQPGLNGRVMNYERGHILGGSTSVSE